MQISDLSDREQRLLRRMLDARQHGARFVGVSLGAGRVARRLAQKNLIDWCVWRRRAELTADGWWLAIQTPQLAHAA